MTYSMTHKIKSVKAMENTVLLVDFQNGIEVGKKEIDIAAKLADNLTKARILRE